MSSTSAENEVKALEGKLKAQLKFKHPDEKVVKPIRRELQEKYVRIVLCDGELASRIGAESNLWKLCFYKKIDEFRRALAKTHEQIRDPTKSAAAEQVMAATTREFSRFLDKSTSFYLALLQKAARGCTLVLPGYERSPNAPWPACMELDEGSDRFTSAHRQHLVATCYRCLIYLGDLERYRGSCQTEIAAHDWTAAGQHYSSALLLRPHSGNPHNQCGVIANYQGDDLAGFYHYFRAILCDDPYLPQARANLEMICRKNRESMVMDVASDSQQRRRVARDAKFRGLVVGRCFVRPLCLLSLLSNLEDVASAQNDVISKLPAWLDADSPPSGLCIRMMSACIFTVFDLERQLQETSQHLERSNENQNGNKPNDLALLRDSYQHALDFTLRVAACMMHSAKSSHHHLDAVNVVCLWLSEHPHLVSPQKQAEKVYYDSARVRRAQQTFAEGLVDLINLLNPSLAKLPQGARPQDSGDDYALPEELLLVGCTPFQSSCDVLRKQGHSKDGPNEVLVAVEVVKNHDAQLRRRLERAAALARILTEAPGPLLSLNPSSGELSVEGYKSAKKRSNQICSESVQTAVAAPQQPGVGFSTAACATSGLDSHSTLRGAAVQICNECGTNERPGRLDEYDGLFYCDVCWANLDALECHDHGGHHAGASVYEGEQGPIASVHDTSMEMLGACADKDDSEQGREDDDETFGSYSLHVDAAGVPASLGDLAQQTAVFAAAASTKFDVWHSSQPPQPQAAPSSCAALGASSIRARPQGSEEADYGYLEHLVQHTVDCDPDARATGNLLGADDEDEMIVFQPRSQASREAPDKGGGADAAPGGGLHRWAAMTTDAGAGVAEQKPQAGGAFAGIHLMPSRSSLWGGFGAGTYGFGATTQNSNLSSIGPQSSTSTNHAAASDSASRFSTRNPFAT